MIKSCIAELRQLLRWWSDETMRHLFFTQTSDAMYQDVCGWLVANVGQWGEQIGELTPAELRMFLTFVLYAETDK